MCTCAPRHLTCVYVGVGRFFSHLSFYCIRHCKRIATLFVIIFIFVVVVDAFRFFYFLLFLFYFIIIIFLFGRVNNAACSFSLVYRYYIIRNLCMYVWAAYNVVELMEIKDVCAVLLLLYRWFAIHLLIHDLQPYSSLPSVVSSSFPRCLSALCVCFFSFLLKFSLGSSFILVHVQHQSPHQQHLRFYLNSTKPLHSP